MSLRIKFKIITPERTVLEEEIDQATLPVTDGEVTILPNHRSYIASLKPGEIMIKKGEKELEMGISGGLGELNKNKSVILADTAEMADEIDLTRAEEARKRAEEAMQRKASMDETEYAMVAAAIERE